MNFNEINDPSLRYYITVAAMAVGHSIPDQPSQLVSNDCVMQCVYKMIYGVLCLECVSYQIFISILLLSIL